MTPFETWWQHWTIPNTKRGKFHAEKAFNKAIKDGATLLELCDGVDRYMEQCRTEGKEFGLIKMPQGWLSGGRWLDDMQPPSIGESCIMVTEGMAKLLKDSGVKSGSRLIAWKDFREATYHVEGAVTPSANPNHVIKNQITVNRAAGVYGPWPEYAP